MKDFIFSADEDFEEFLRNSKWLIHSLVIEGVKKSLEDQLDEIIVFRIINSENNYQMNTKRDFVQAHCYVYYSICRANKLRIA